MKEKLNWFHIALLVHMFELDTTVFSQSRVLAENIGTNAWAALIPLSAIASMNLLLYLWLYRIGGGQSVYRLMHAVIPKPLLYPVYLALAGFWIYIGGLTGKNFILISQMFALYSTNPMAIYLLYCGMVFALLTKGLYAIVKATTVFFFMFIWVNALVPYFATEWSVHRLTPYLFQGAEHGLSLHGLAESYVIFAGYEFCLFLFPYTDKKSKLFKGVFLGHWVITLLYTNSVLLAFGFFSFEEVQELQFPLISTLEYLELPFLNRPENLVFTFFIYPNLISSVLFGFAALTALREVFSRAKGKWLEGAIVIAMFLSGYAVTTLIQSELLIRNAKFIEIGLAFAMPAALIPIAYIARRKGAGKGA
ncbi:GerAB/ArcD/ProY family transporter [Cohnella lubricantis]|uniref:GerAB/ArcD/ProY family transporter n=1 Tax=Cohnella lubricantis TaxID=2163172 RepID=A0A841T7G8_9BACL|nr:GerAB/ArcD/ProY family transporter [Cohnella lubricantis]MBB6675996.1 GerAB/ArcD/ProY family transporter [Cohnella lubricantis]MBP2117884.1 hypothetical protein [Cohnella lubricantis]